MVCSQYYDSDSDLSVITADAGASATRRRPSRSPERRNDNEEDAEEFREVDSSQDGESQVEEAIAMPILDVDEWERSGLFATVLSSQDEELSAVAVGTGASAPRRRPSRSPERRNGKEEEEADEEASQADEAAPAMAALASFAPTIAGWAGWLVCSCTSLA